jgi:hypothetical protein
MEDDLMREKIADVNSALDPAIWIAQDRGNEKNLLDILMCVREMLDKIHALI